MSNGLFLYFFSVPANFIFSLEHICSFINHVIMCFLSIIIIKSIEYLSVSMSWQCSQLVNKLLVTIFEYICALRNQGISYSLCPKRKWKFLPKRPVLNLSFASFKCFKVFENFTKHFFHFLEESSWSHIWMIVIYSRHIIGHKLWPSDLHLHLSRAATSFLWAVIT